MRLANANGRAVIVVGDEIADVAEVSAGAIGPDPMTMYADWPLLLEVAASLTTTTGPLVTPNLRCPVPTPRQVFAIGLNYRSHAEESGMEIPSVPATFTKFPTSLAGPFDDVEVMGEAIDWEAELVAVIGTRADRVAEADGWSHIAGLTVGQDISDRHLQFAAGSQFSLGKSRRGYGPMGPWITTPDELDNPDDLRISCTLNGDVMQQAHTADLIFGVSQLVAELSAVLPLLAGDVIFTGTPAGIGITRQPPRLLRVGDVLETTVDGIGTIRNTFVEPR